MASNPNDQKKRSSAMRTAGEGVPPRSAVVPTIGAEEKENKRNSDQRPSKQPVRKKKRSARSISNSSGN
jgi:hypothetical protein